MKEGFTTPPKHINFNAKKLFGDVGQIIDGSIAYINLKGGGPTEQHTHKHNHLFVVVKGEAKVLLLLVKRLSGNCSFENKER